MRTKLERRKEGSKDRGMKEDEREGVFGGRRFEEEDVTVWEEAVDEAGAWRSVHGEAEVADGGSAVVADANGGAEAPEETPPRAGWSGAEFGAIFGDGLRACGVGSGAEFAVDFVGVGVPKALSLSNGGRSWSRRALADSRVRI